MSLYEVLKASKTERFPDYWTLLLGRKLSASMIKTLTGVLPLTFSTSEEQLRDWTIYGNNTPHNYSATGTLPLTFTTHTAGAANDWVIEGNDENGTEQLLPDSVGLKEITAQTTDTVAQSIGTIHLTPGVYTLHRYQNDTLTSDVRNVMLYTSRPQSTMVYEEGATTENRCLAAGWYSWTFTLAQESDYNFYWWVHTPNTEVTSTNFVLTKGETTAPDHYIPYQQGVGEQRVDGYYVPLTISQTGQPDKNYDIYIGGSPLTAGQSISKTSTGVDLELSEGENTISTTLYNKPSMSIEGVDYVGVGEPTNDGWQIPLTVSDGTNTTTVNVPIDAPLTAGETVSKTSTGVDINTADGTNTINTTLENKPEMLVYYGYKGAGVHSGNTWEFNFITQANGNQQLTKITMDKPLRAGETLTSEQAGVTIPTYADAENTLSLYPSAAGYGNPEMTITYKGG